MAAEVCDSGTFAFIGDGFCDDENNNKNCFFDGGDCCFNVRDEFCSDCACYFGDMTLVFNNSNYNTEAPSPSPITTEMPIGNACVR